MKSIRRADADVQSDKRHHGAGYLREVDFDIALGQLVTRWRASAGLTQQSLGAAVGLDQATISRIESGDRKVDVELLLQVLVATGLSLPAVAPTIQDLSPANPSLWNEQ